MYIIDTNSVNNCKMEPGQGILDTQILLSTQFRPPIYEYCTFFKLNENKFYHISAQYSRKFNDT